MNGTMPRPPRWRTPDELAVEVGRQVTMTDDLTSELLAQVVQLEEILAARWPRSVLVRRRWRRDVRASVRHMEGSTWAWRRLNAIGTDWLSRDGAPLPGRGDRARAGSGH